MDQHQQNFSFLQETLSLWVKDGNQARIQYTLDLIQKELAAVEIQMINTTKQIEKAENDVETANKQIYEAWVMFHEADHRRNAAEAHATKAEFRATEAKRRAIMAECDARVAWKRVAQLEADTASEDGSNSVWNGDDNSGIIDDTLNIAWGSEESVLNVENGTSAEEQNNHHGWGSNTVGERTGIKSENPSNDLNWTDGSRNGWPTVEQVNRRPKETRASVTKWCNGENTPVNFSDFYAKIDVSTRKGPWRCAFETNG